MNIMRCLPRHIVSARTLPLIMAYGVGAIFCSCVEIWESGHESGVNAQQLEPLKIGDVTLVSMAEYPGHRNIYISKNLITVDAFREFAHDLDYHDTLTPYKGTGETMGVDPEGPEPLISGISWLDPFPGIFDQPGDHPVVAVSYLDAMEFCRWLTFQEQNRGTICSDSYFRLPQHSEILLTTNGRNYPWGDDWPPPDGFRANLSGTTTDDSGDHAFVDEWIRTSPVGAGSDQDLLIQDVFGNVEEWTCTIARGMISHPSEIEGRNTPFISLMVAGSSWTHSAEPDAVKMSRTGRGVFAFSGWNTIGFRVVLVKEKNSH